jgi:hypothetical protein
MVNLIKELLYYSNIHLQLGFGALERRPLVRKYIEIAQAKRPTLNTASSFVASIMLPLVFSLPVMYAFWPLSFGDVKM